MTVAAPPARRWALVLGAKGGDRAAVVLRVARALSLRGLTVGGVVQEPVVENGQRVGYRALRIGGGGEIGVARPPTASRAGSEEEYCSYLFDAAAFATARGWIEEAANTAQVVIVDEVSKLEVAGRGHHDAVRSALAGRALPLLGVRGDQLFGVMERFGLPEPIAAAETSGEAVERALVEAVVRALS